LRYSPTRADGPILAAAFIGVKVDAGGRPAGIRIGGARQQAFLTSGGKERG